MPLLNLPLKFYSVLHRSWFFPFCPYAVLPLPQLCLAQPWAHHIFLHCILLSCFTSAAVYADAAVTYSSTAVSSAERDPKIRVHATSVPSLDYTSGSVLREMVTQAAAR